MTNYEFDFCANCLEDTLFLGRVLGENLPKGAFVALIGDLAAGKTALSRQICLTRGFSKGFSSPSFAIMNEYTSADSRYAYHLDVYRIEDPRELEYTGFPECSADADIVLIEWAELIAELLPKDTLYIHIERSDEEEKRLFKISCTDEKLITTIKEKSDALSCC